MSTVSMEEHWQELVTAALLGTDRRDPPPPAEPIADLVADTVREAPSERMLAQVAACTAVRRAAFTPGPALPQLAPPDIDERPVCPPAAVDRWGHLSVSWPVLEDEWAVLLLRHGWRLAPELVPTLLRRHRNDALRRARVLVAAGPLAPWLVDLVPDLDGTAAAARIDPGALDVLPELPIPPELVELSGVPADDASRAIASGVASGRFGHAHRGVLVNLVARLDAAALLPVATRLESIDPLNQGAALAHSLADLARTRQRVHVELDPSST
jgi:hypothetical protein